MSDSRNCRMKGSYLAQGMVVEAVIGRFQESFAWIVAAAAATKLAPSLSVD